MHSTDMAEGSMPNDRGVASEPRRDDLIGLILPILLRHAEIDGPLRIGHTKIL